MDLVLRGHPLRLRGAAPESANAPVREQGAPWKPEELVGGGPMLVSRSVLANREVAECFQSLGGTSRHPRTAAGWTKDGTLLLLVVDGRSKASRGATLAETGRMLLAHGAHEGLNLDGGGSSTLWVAGRILNTPSDRSGERPVGSVLALVPAKHTSHLSLQPTLHHVPPPYS